MAPETRHHTVLVQHARAMHRKARGRRLAAGGLKPLDVAAKQGHRRTSMTPCPSRKGIAAQTAREQGHVRCGRRRTAPATLFTDAEDTHATLPGVSVRRPARSVHRLSIMCRSCSQPLKLTAQWHAPNWLFVPCTQLTSSISQLPRRFRCFTISKRFLMFPRPISQQLAIIHPFLERVSCASIEDCAYHPAKLTAP